MGTKTTRLDLTKPGENDYYNQQTEQADNWQKVDDYAVYTDRDKNAIWGGLDGGGLIEDPSVTKVVGKRYIGADGKAYICLKPSNINNSTNYAPCNVVDNLDKLQNLPQLTGYINGPYDSGSDGFFQVRYTKILSAVIIIGHCRPSFSTIKIPNLIPNEIRPSNLEIMYALSFRVEGTSSSASVKIYPDGTIEFGGSHTGNSIFVAMYNI